MSNFSAAAKTLDELMLELIKKGVEIPRHVKEDLKSGRSLASMGSRQPEAGDVADKTMVTLENVEMNLLALAEINFGSDTAESWQRRISESYQEQPSSPLSTPSSRIASGVPRGDHWIRIQSDYIDTVEGADELLEASAVSIIRQEDGYILIHGRKEDVSAFLGEIRQIIGKMGSECSN